jgi:hypothetical protein
VGIIGNEDNDYYGWDRPRSPGIATVRMESTMLSTLRVCQGTPAAVLTQANIRASALNKGGSGDPGAQSAVGHTARGQAVSGIYTRNHSRYYLLIVMLLA